MGDPAPPTQEELGGSTPPPLPPSSIATDFQALYAHQALVATEQLYVTHTQTSQPPSLQQSLVKEVQIVERRRTITAESR